MNRRQFLTLAGATTGYSVIVRVDSLATAHAALPTREEISRQFDVIAPPSPSVSGFAAEPHMTLVDLACDVFIAGGGMAGVWVARGRPRPRGGASSRHARGRRQPKGLPQHGGRQAFRHSCGAIQYPGEHEPHAHFAGTFTRQRAGNRLRS